MEYFKLQIGCMFVVIYIAFSYCKEQRRYRRKWRPSMFDSLIALAIAEIFFDGATAYTVNHLDTVSPVLNTVLHLFFLLSLDSIIFLLFIYMISITKGLPEKKRGWIILHLPFVVNLILLVANIHTLEYIQGETTNYSMGTAAYTCFIMAGIYIVLCLVTFFKCWKYIESKKRANIFLYTTVLIVTGGYQMINPEALVTSIGVTVSILGIYLNVENPAVTELTRYHEEMTVGFATLVDNKDGSTGGHIKRTSQYVKLLIRELQRRGYYKEILTKDFANNLYRAAPMHDIGKISIPDGILQKPGKLTPEEFEIMKTHAVKGGEIILETFGHMENKEYTQMAYRVARYHHEKWNGKGYPEGLRGEEIPLCARIMAIADVFDAVSEKRCYRDAMPMDRCFQIIEEGVGSDFDPVLARVFLEIRPKVEKVHRTCNE